MNWYLLFEKSVLIFNIVQSRQGVLTGLHEWKLKPNQKRSLSSFSQKWTGGARERLWDGLWYVSRNSKCMPETNIAYSFRCKAKISFIKSGSQWPRIYRYQSCQAIVCQSVSRESIGHNPETCNDCLCGLLIKWKHLITAIDAVRDKEKLTHKFVKISRLLEEQIVALRSGLYEKQTDLA